MRSRVLLVVLLIGIILVGSGSLLLYLNSNGSLFNSASLYWDGGAWSQPLQVNSNEPTVLEFRGKIYMFYSVITENTMDNDDMVLFPKEHILTDVLYRVFDGSNFTEAFPLSSPTDKVSVSGKYFVFKGELYAVLSEWWISDYASYETEARTYACVFDGESWREEPWPFVEDSHQFHGLGYFNYGDKVWAIWQYMKQPVAGKFSDVFGFRTFDGEAWSETRNFTNPTGTPGDWKVAVAGNRLWFVWDNLAFYNDPVTQLEPHNDVWLGSFDGETWSNVTLLSAPDDNGSNWGFFLAEYKNELFAFCGGQYLDTSEQGEWVWVMRRLSLSNGSLSGLTPIAPEIGYKLKPWSTLVFEGRLYTLWFSAYQGWKSMIQSFDGEQWSSVYRFDRGYDADGVFIYDGKLWVYGTDESSALNEVGWTYLRSYTRSG